MEVSGSLIPDFIIRRQSPISGGGGGNWQLGRMRSAGVAVRGRVSARSPVAAPLALDVDGGQI